MPKTPSSHNPSVQTPPRRGRPVVGVCEPIAPEARAWLGERCEVIDAGSEPSDEALARSQGLVVRTYTDIDAALLARAPGLRVVGRAGVGLDNIDLRACADAGVRVVHAPEANAGAVAELVFASVLRVVRPMPRVTGAMDADAWRELRERSLAPAQLEGSTLGVLGLGRVGRRVARAGAALRMRVIYHDILDIPPAEREGGVPVKLDELLGQSDVLSVHVDGREANRGLIGEQSLAMMKAGVVLVNTSRGFVVREDACAGFLRQNPGATAILDVHAEEPIGERSPLLGQTNAVLLPHIGSATRGAKLAMSWVVRDVVAVLRGEDPAHEARGS